MLNVWPIFVTGLEVGLIIALVAWALIQFGLSPLLEKEKVKQDARRETGPPRRM